MKLSQLTNKTQIAEGVLNRRNTQIVVGYRLMQKEGDWLIESKPMVKGERRWLTVHSVRPSDDLDQVIAELRVKLPSMSILRVI